MAVVKSFAFRSSSDENPEVRRKVQLKLPGGQDFDLRDDLTGIELLELVAGAVGGPGSTRGIAVFFRRTVNAKDWDRFSKACEGATPDELGTLCGELIDAYSSFPTTPEDGSSAG